MYTYRAFLQLWDWMKNDKVNLQSFGWRIKTKTPFVRGARTNLIKC